MYIVQIKTRGGHDPITLKNDHKSGHDHICQVPSIITTLPGLTNVCFDITSLWCQKEPRLLVTAFFMFMTTI